MNPWLILLAAYGAATIWIENYQPWLASFVNPDESTSIDTAPPWATNIAYLLIRRYGAGDRAGSGAQAAVSQKPWTCPLCMSFLAAVPLWLCSLWTPTQVFVVAFAASGATWLLGKMYDYMKVATG